MTDALARQQKTARTLVWIVPALWSVNYIVARMAVGVIGPHLLALGRWTIAAVVLVMLARAELWQQRAQIAATGGNTWSWARWAC
jgi:hypothetical protein